MDFKIGDIIKSRYNPEKYLVLSFFNGRNRILGVKLLSFNLDPFPVVELLKRDFYLFEKFL